MTIAYASRDGASLTSLGSSTLTITKPSGTVQGDLLIVYIICSANVTITPVESGWTTDATAAGIRAYRRIAGASEPASYGFTRSATTNNIVGHMVRLTSTLGFPANPVDAVGAQAGGSGTTVVLPTLTVVDGTFLWQMGQIISNSTFTPPGTATEDYDYQPATQAYGVFGGHEAISAGATGTRTWTASLTGTRSGIMYSLKENALTAVGASQATAYDLAAPVGASQATAVDLSAPVGASRDTAVDLAAAVGSSQATATDLSAAVGASRATAVDLAAPVGASQATATDLSAPVGASQPTAVDVAVTVGAAQATATDLASAVGASRATAYDLSAPAGASQATALDLAAAVGASQATAVDVAAAVGASQATAYDLTVTVGAEEDTEYAIGATAGASRATAYDLAAPAGSSQPTAYDLAAPAGASRSTAWDLAAAVGAARATAYDVLGLAGAEQPTEWDLAELAGAEQATEFSMGGMVGASQDTSWSMGGAVGAEQATEFDVAVVLPDWPVTDPTRAIAGVVRDHETGAVAPGATVRLFRTFDDRRVQTTTAGLDGTYSFPRDTDDPYTYYVTVTYTLDGTDYQGISPRDCPPA